MIKPLVLRAVAYEDIESAAGYYIEVGGDELALRFASALQAAYRKIADRPKIGSSVLGDDVKIAGLRTRKLAHFPYLVLYFEQEEQIDIWRVLHAQRDIPVDLRESEP